MAKRMKLISESEFEILKKRKEEPFESEKLKLENKDEIAREFLFSKSIPDDIKIQIYGSMLRHLTSNYETIINKPIKVENVEKQEHKCVIPTSASDIEKSAAETIESEVPLSEHDKYLINFIPSIYKENAEILMQRLKQHSADILWDNVGQVSFDSGKSYAPNVNIGDLIVSAVKPKTLFENENGPIGFSRFKNVIRKLHIPIGLLTPKVRQDIIQQIKTKPDVEHFISSRKSNVKVVQKPVIVLKDWDSYDKKKSRCKNTLAIVKQK